MLPVLFLLKLTFDTDLSNIAIETNFALYFEKKKDNIMCAHKIHPIIKQKDNVMCALQIHPKILLSRPKTKLVPIPNIKDTIFSLIIAHVRLLFQNLRFQVSPIIANVRLLDRNENSIKCLIFSIEPLLKT